MTHPPYQAKDKQINIKFKISAFCKPFSMKMSIFAEHKQ